MSTNAASQERSEKTSCQCPIARPAAKRDSAAGTFARSGQRTRRVRRAHRGRSRFDGPSAEVRELLLFRLLAGDFEHQAGHHAGGHSHDQELRALERGLQFDAQSEMRAFRFEESLAGFAPPGAIRPGVRQTAGHQGARRAVRRRLAARHGRAAVGQGKSQILRRTAGSPRSRPRQALASGRTGVRLDARRSRRHDGPAMEFARSFRRL